MVGSVVGLGWGRTVALDDETFVSYRYGLVGRPDRLIRHGDTVIPEEWKSARRVWPNHRAQLGVDFLLIGVRAVTEQKTDISPVGCGKPEPMPATPSLVLSQIMS